MLGVVGRVARRWGRWTLAVCVLAAILLAFHVLPLSVDVDVATLFPPDDTSVADLRYFQQNFGTTEMAVLVTPDESVTMRQKMTDMESWMRASPFFTRAQRLTLPPGVKGEALAGYPKKSAMNHAFAKEMIAAVQDQMRALDLHAELTGIAAVSAEAIDSLNNDVTRTSIISFILVVLILFVAIRDPLFPVFAVIPLLIGVLFTIAFAKTAYGRITLMTSSIPTALLGMGIDYAVYLRNCRREFHLDSRDVWFNVYHRIAPAMLMGVLATAAALFSLCWASGGLKEMGVVGGVGILIVFILTILTLPTLHDWRARIRFNLALPSDEWLGRLAHRIVRHRRVVIGAFLVVTATLLQFAMELRLDMDPSSYRDPTQPALIAFLDFQKRANVCLEPILLAVPNRAAEQRVLEKVRPLVGDTDSKTFAIVNCLTTQMEIPGAKYNISDFRGADKRLCMTLLPREHPYDGDNLPRLVKTTRKLVADCGPDVERVSGMPIVWNNLMDLSNRDLRRTTLVAAIGVVLVLSVLMRRPRYVLAAVVPLAGSVIWMLGIIRLAGFQFSLVSAVSMPLVLGLGIGYGVYIVQRLRHDTVERAVVLVGRAIIVSASTTACAFFALATARNRGLAGMGLAAGAGIAASLLWSLLFLPAFAAELQRRRTRADQSSEDLKNL